MLHGSRPLSSHIIHDEVGRQGQLPAGLCGCRIVPTRCRARRQAAPACWLPQATDGLDHTSAAAITPRDMLGASLSGRAAAGTQLNGLQQVVQRPVALHKPETSGRGDSEHPSPRGVSNSGTPGASSSGRMGAGPEPPSRPALPTSPLQRPSVMQRPDVIGHMAPGYVAGYSSLLRMPPRMVEALMLRNHRLRSVTPAAAAAAMVSLAATFGLSHKEVCYMVSKQPMHLLTTPAADVAAHAAALAVALGVDPAAVLDWAKGSPSVLKRDVPQLVHRVRTFAEMLRVDTPRMMRMMKEAPQYLTDSYSGVQRRLLAMGQVLLMGPTLVCRIVAAQPDLVFMSSRIFKNKVSVLMSLFDRDKGYVCRLVLKHPQLMHGNADRMRAVYEGLPRLLGVTADFVSAMVWHDPALLLETPESLGRRWRRLQKCIERCPTWEDEWRWMEPPLKQKCVMNAWNSYSRLEYLLASKQAHLGPFAEALLCPSAVFAAGHPKFHTWEAMRAERALQAAGGAAQAQVRTPNQQQLQQQQQQQHSPSVGRPMPASGATPPVLPFRELDPTLQQRWEQQQRHEQQQQQQQQWQQLQLPYQAHLSQPYANSSSGQDARSRDAAWAEAWWLLPPYPSGRAHGRRDDRRDSRQDGRGGISDVQYDDDDDEYEYRVQATQARLRREQQNAAAQRQRSSAAAAAAAANPDSHVLRGQRVLQRKQAAEKLKRLAEGGWVSSAVRRLRQRRRAAERKLLLEATNGNTIDDAGDRGSKVLSRSAVRWLRRQLRRHLASDREQLLEGTSRDSALDCFLASSTNGSGAGASATSNSSTASTSSSNGSSSSSRVDSIRALLARHAAQPVARPTRLHWHRRTTPKPFSYAWRQARREEQAARQAGDSSCRGSRRSSSSSSCDGSNGGGSRGDDANVTRRSEAGGGGGGGGGSEARTHNTTKADSSQQLNASLPRQGDALQASTDVGGCADAPPVRQHTHDPSRMGIQDAHTVAVDRPPCALSPSVPPALVAVPASHVAPPSRSAASASNGAVGASACTPAALSSAVSGGPMPSARAACTPVTAGVKSSSAVPSSPRLLVVEVAGQLHVAPSSPTSAGGTHKMHQPSAESSVAVAAPLPSPLCDNEEGVTPSTAVTIRAPAATTSAAAAVTGTAPGVAAAVPAAASMVNGARHRHGAQRSLGCAAHGFHDSM